MGETKHLPTLHLHSKLLARQIFLKALIFEKKVWHDTEYLVIFLAIPNTETTSVSCLRFQSLLYPCEEQSENKTVVLITGASNGIGLAAAETASNRRQVFRDRYTARAPENSPKLLALAKRVSKPPRHET